MSKKNLKFLNFFTPVSKNSWFYLFFRSYSIPIRTIAKPPYEVKETGWGEFDVEIKIFIADSSNKTIRKGLIFLSYGS